VCKLEVEANRGLHLVFARCEIREVVYNGDKFQQRRNAVSTELLTPSKLGKPVIDYPRKTRETVTPAIATPDEESESDLDPESIGVVKLPILNKTVRVTLFPLGPLKPMPVPELDD
jgi:hypothetical protein